MNFTLNFSLKDIALTSVALGLWTAKNLKALALEYYEKTNKSDVWIRNVGVEVRQLILPENLRKELLHMTEVLASEIRTWVKFHGRFGDVFGYGSAVDPFEFCWTTQGMIDKKKTAESIVKDKSISVLTRYKFACSYCLESSIRMLYSELDRISRQAIKRSIRVEMEEDNGDGDPFPLVSVHRDQLLIFWSYVMDNEINETNQADPNNRVFGAPFQFVHNYRYAFEGAAFGGNEVAVKYFLEKLTVEEEEKLLVKTACTIAELANLRISRIERFCKVYYSNVLIVLLSAMNETQQMEVLRSDLKEVLHCFLEWPWQQFLISTAERMWEFLSPSNYKFLVQQIMDADIVTMYQYYSYQNLFRLFWKLSPHTHRSYVIENNISKTFYDLLKMQRHEDIILILQYATTEQKEDLIRDCKDICRILICARNADFLRSFLVECLPSVEVRSIIERLCQRVATLPSVHVPQYRVAERKINKFLDEIIGKGKKRKNE